MSKSKARHMGDMMGADGVVKASSAPTVANARLGDGSVTTLKIADSNVTTAKIADINVTTAKIADNAVNSDKVTPTLAVGVPTTVISSSATAVANNHYFIDTATQTLTLPASPTAGQKVSVTVGNFTDTTVARNSENIASAAEDLTIDVANLGVTLCYTNASRGWVIL